MTSGTSRMTLAVDLQGYGQVARALLPLLPKCGIRVATVRDRSGVRLRHAVRGAQHVFVDVASPRYDGGEAEDWTRRIEEVLESGTPVVTCNKAPLAVAWPRLERAARRGSTTVSCSATVGGGTPVLLFLQRLHESQGIERVDAALSATLGYVCSHVAAGATIPEAVRQAQLSGWAEPDPVLDLDGTDSYAKAVIIHNLLFSSNHAILLGRERPRLSLDEGRIRQLARLGKTPQVRATVRPGAVTHELVGLDSGDALRDAIGRVSVHTVLRGGLGASISGPGAGPQVVAGALARDLRALMEVRETRAGGITP